MRFAILALAVIALMMQSSAQLSISIPNQLRSNKFTLESNKDILVFFHSNGLVYLLGCNVLKNKFKEQGNAFTLSLINWSYETSTLCANADEINTALKLGSAATFKFIGTTLKFYNSKG